MVNLEKGLELGQGSGATRTLSREALRVILSLTSIGPEPLSREGADTFNHVIRGDKPKSSDYLITRGPGIYYFDFKPLEGDDGSANLSQAIRKIDTALIKTMLPVEISGAWTMPAFGPLVSPSTSDWKESATDITARAQEMFATHHTDLISTMMEYDSLFFES